MSKHWKTWWEAMTLKNMYHSSVRHCYHHNHYRRHTTLIITIRTTVLFVAVITTIIITVASPKLHHTAIVIITIRTHSSVHRCYHHNHYHRRIAKTSSHSVRLHIGIHWVHMHPDLKISMETNKLWPKSHHKTILRTSEFIRITYIQIWKEA